MIKNDANGLSDRQRKALPHLVACGTYEAGCAQARISKNAFYEWLRDPLFKYELDKMRDTVIDESVAILKANITKAATALAALIDRNESPAIVRGAANDIIGHVFKAKEMQEIERRLEALETLYGERNVCR